LIRRRPRPAVFIKEHAVWFIEPIDGYLANTAGASCLRMGAGLIARVRYPKCLGIRSPVDSRGRGAIFCEFELMTVPQ